MVQVSSDGNYLAVNPANTSVDVAGTIFQADEKRVVNFLWMRNHYGDPRSGEEHAVAKSADGTSELIQSRHNERLRLNVMWGRYEDAPPIEFYALDGERILTVYDDPMGDNISAAFTSVSEQAKMQATIADQQRKIQQLLEITGLTNEAIPSEPTDIPEDDSTAPRTTSPWAHAETDVPGVAI